MIVSHQFSSVSPWIESIPQRIALTGAAVTLVGLATWISWLITGDYTLVNAFFRYPSPLFTLAICTAGAALSFQAWSRFEPTDALRPAWLWLSLASVALLAGRTMTTLGIDELGRVIAGPLQMSLLLAGLIRVLITCHRLRMLRRLHAIDYVLFLVVAGFLVRTINGISAFTSGGKPVTFTTAALWTSDPLLLLLLVTAILIRRAMAPLGYGLLANCWRSFIAGIVLTSLGAASSWCLDCETIPVWTSLGWYVWFVSDCAFALGPAFQAAALEHVRSRARVYHVFSDLAFWRIP